MTDHTKLNENNLKFFPEGKPLILTDLSGKTVYKNEKFADLFGGSIEDINSDPNLKILLQNIVENKYKNFNFEINAAKLNSQRMLPYKIDLEIVEIEDKSYFLILFTSYREREEIAARINNLNNALEYGDVPVMIVNEETRITYVSRAFEKILGKGLEKIYNAFLTDVLTEFLDEREKEKLESALHDDSVWQKTISDLSENGELWYKELKLNPIKRGEFENTDFILTAHDITHHIVKNRLIKKSEQRQKLIIENISDPLLIIRREKEDLIFDDANDNFFVDFSLNKKNTKGEPLSDIVPSVLYSKIRMAIDRVKDYPEQQMQFRYSSSRNLREYLCKLSFAETLYEKTEMFIISLMDITEQLKTERMLRLAYEKETRLNKLKSAFLANMSHEIRTPLNAVVGYSDLLEDEIESENFEDLDYLVKAMKDGVDRLLLLIDNIVEVSMLESGEYKIELAKVIVNDLLKAEADTIVTKLAQKSIAIDMDLKEDISPVYLDPNKLEKVLTEILDNAIKYNRENGIILMRSYENEEGVIIEITDTGIGIETDRLRDIVEPFSRVEDEGYRRRFEGAGLGFTIAYKITNLMNGKIEIDSMPNEGTTVRLIFPPFMKKNETKQSD
ncbi:MAG: PAS domain S-box protein [Chlorobi bacterium]|nr:PAS domain S-box protein [Chlorobiota bacterium]